jgi:hypothetical protein
VNICIFQPLHSIDLLLLAGAIVSQILLVDTIPLKVNNAIAVVDVYRLVHQLVKVHLQRTSRYLKKQCFFSFSLKIMSFVVQLAVAIS